MKRTNRVTALVFIGLTASLAGQGWAQDWPQWRGPNRDAKAAGFNAPKTWPKELTQKWKVTVGPGDASPALVEDKLYLFTREEGQEVTRCLDAGTGKEIWQDKYTAPAVNGPDSPHGGPRSSPTVADGKVFTLGVCGTVSCLDSATGKMLWRKDDFSGSWPRFHTAMSPIVVDGLCIVQLGKESEGAVVAYDVSTGDQKWKWADEGPGYASPVVLSVGDTRMLVALTAKSVVGIGVKDGKLLWQAAFAPQGMAYNAATPIIDGQTIYYCGQGRGTKAINIEKQGEGFAAKELWSNPDNAVQFNSPVLKNGLLFGLSQRGTFFCINAQTGKTVWTDPTGGRGGFGSIVDGGSILVALTSKSQLSVFEPSDKEYVEVASLKVADKQTYAYPILAGNRIFIKDQDAIILWTVD